MFTRIIFTCVSPRIPERRRRLGKRTTRRKLRRVAPPRRYAASLDVHMWPKLGHTSLPLSLPTPNQSVCVSVALGEAEQRTARRSVLFPASRDREGNGSSTSESYESVAERKSAAPLRSRIGPVTESSGVGRGTKSGVGRARATARGRRPKIHPCHAHAALAPSLSVAASLAGSPSFYLFAPSPLSFSPSPYLPPFASVRRAAPCRLPAATFSLSFPAFFPPPALCSSHSHYFARPFVFSLSRAIFRAKFSHSSLIRVYSSHRCFRPLVLLVARSAPLPLLFPSFSFSRSSPFCSVSFFFPLASPSPRVSITMSSFPCCNPLLA